MEDSLQVCTRGTAAMGQGPHVAEEADQRLFAAIGGEVGRAMN